MKSFPSGLSSRVADSLDEVKAAFRAAGEAARVAEPFVGTALVSRTRARARTCHLEHNPHLDALAALTTLHREQAEIMQQIRVSQETVEQSQELLRRLEQQLAKSPLKP